MTFDDITSKVRLFSMETVAEVQKMNEVRQLNSSINAEKKKIHSMYMEMGKKLYDRYRENPLEGFEDEFEAIKSEFENIEVLRGKVRAKKGVTLCPNCKMEVGEFERFCSNCGCKMPEIFKIEEEEPAGALEAEESSAQANEENDLPEAEVIQDVAESVAEAAEDIAESVAEAVEAAVETEAEAAEDIAEAGADVTEDTVEAGINAAENTAETVTDAAEKSVETGTDAVSEV
ncbi:MAG: hypothetical protein LUD16_07450 [Lachnospiraceae bacterium]|nr:hypothetical protein [Lachnospiraceae bacterium]